MTPNQQQTSNAELLIRAGQLTERAQIRAKVEVLRVEYGGTAAQWALNELLDFIDERK